MRELRDLRSPGRDLLDLRSQGRAIVNPQLDAFGRHGAGARVHHADGDRHGAIRADHVAAELDLPGRQVVPGLGRCQRATDDFRRRGKLRPARTGRQQTSGDESPGVAFAHPPADGLAIRDEHDLLARAGAQRQRSRRLGQRVDRLHRAPHGLQVVQGGKDFLAIVGGRGDDRARRPPGQHEAEGVRWVGGGHHGPGLGDRSGEIRFPVGLERHGRRTVDDQGDILLPGTAVPETMLQNALQQRQRPGQQQQARSDAQEAIADLPIAPHPAGHRVEHDGNEHRRDHQRPGHHRPGRHERPGQRQGKQPQQKTPQRQEDDFLDADTPVLRGQRLFKKAHRPPLHHRRLATIQQVNHNRDRDGCEPSQHGKVKEGHVWVARLLGTIRLWS